MDCFGTYFTHAQSCDNVRVPSASGHMLNFRVFAFSRFRVFAFSRFPVFAFSCLVFAFSRFRVFVFSRFRVFAFCRRHPRGRATHFVCTVVELIHSQNSSEILFTKDVYVKSLSLICLSCKAYFSFFVGLGFFLNRQVPGNLTGSLFLARFIVASSRQTMKLKQEQRNEGHHTNSNSSPCHFLYLTPSLARHRIFVKKCLFS